MAKEKMVQKLLEFDQDDIDKFNRAYPIHGAFTRVMRKLLKQHLATLDKDLTRFFEGRVL